MKETFDLAFELVIGHEGGYTNDSRDRGNWTTGKIGSGTLKGTKYGVSAMAYPHLDIKNLTLQDAKDIYRRDYWNKARCDDLPFPLDYLTFDSAINHGVSRGVRFLQTAAGSGVDGAIGPKTVAAAQATLDLSNAVTVFCVTRGLFYTDIGTFQTYKKGWFNRLFATHAVAISGLIDMDNQGFDDDEVHCGKAAVDLEPDPNEITFWENLSAQAEEAAERAAQRVN